MFEFKNSGIKSRIEDMNNVRQQIIEEMREEKTKLFDELSKYDSYENDLLHYIEFEPCDAIMSAKLMKALKKNRHNRRMIKNEISQLDCMVGRMLNNVTVKTDENKNKTYKYRIADPNNILEWKGEE